MPGSSGGGARRAPAGPRRAARVLLTEPAEWSAWFLRRAACGGSSVRGHDRSGWAARPGGPGGAAGGSGGGDGGSVRAVPAGGSGGRAGLAGVGVPCRLAGMRAVGGDAAVVFAGAVAV